MTLRSRRAAAAIVVGGVRGMRRIALVFIA